MIKSVIRVALLSLTFLSVCSINSFAKDGDTTTVKKKRKGEFYVSWGYNGEWYTQSNIHVQQPDLGNNYTYQRVNANDHKSLNFDLFHEALTIPQFNCRIGYFLGDSQDLGIELNYDHAKYLFTDQQLTHLTGRLGNRQVDTSFIFVSPSNYYYLNNGANWGLVNIIKRWHVYKMKDGNLKVDVITKAGIGPCYPHVQDCLFGNTNIAHFQIGGVNIGTEGVLRITILKYAYFEYCNKLDYARYWGLRVYEGTSSLGFGAYEMIVNIGVTFPIGKRVE